MVLGLILIATGVGIYQYFMWTQRLHIEGTTEVGVFAGLALVLVGITYAIKPGTLTKGLMGLLMGLANAGFIAAFYTLSTESPKYPVYWNYLYYIQWVFFPAWLIINTGETYYFLQVGK